MQALYQDSQVAIYRDAIVISKYYFPLATSKTILWAEIQYLLMQSSEGVAHRWGVCRKYLNNWFPLDVDRKKKSKFIEIVLKGKKTRPSITPDDPEKVFQIIWQLATPEGQKAEKQTQLTPPSKAALQTTEENISVQDNKIEIK